MGVTLGVDAVGVGPLPFNLDVEEASRGSELVVLEELDDLGELVGGDRGDRVRHIVLLLLGI